MVKNEYILVQFICTILHSTKVTKFPKFSPYFLEQDRLRSLKGKES